LGDGVRACASCGSEYAEDLSFCPRDGTPLPSLLAQAPAARVGSVLAGQIELREPCGTGSMGTVFRAWQSTMERDVAVKVLRRELLATPTLVRRFYREARAAARLSHPNIVVVHALGETAEQLPFIVMEYVAGESLAQLCQQQGALPVPRALGIARQIASALVEAHEHDVVHRDLKPANILLQRRSSGGDCVKVVDFGIAKIVSDGACDGEQSQLTQTGAIFGTPHYLAPEQAAGADVDGRADLYALGVILFLMLTGRLPFPNPNGLEVLVQQLQEPPPRPRDLAPHLSAELEALVLRALRKDRAQRWPTAAALHEALLALEGDAAAAAGGRDGLRSTSALAPPIVGPRAAVAGGPQCEGGVRCERGVPATLVPWGGRRSTWAGSLVLAAALGATAGALTIRALGQASIPTLPAVAVPATRDAVAPPSARYTPSPAEAGDAEDAEEGRRGRGPPSARPSAERRAARRGRSAGATRGGADARSDGRAIGCARIGAGVGGASGAGGDPCADASARAHAGRGRRGVDDPGGGRTAW
jgi:hypothetical protein